MGGGGSSSASSYPPCVSSLRWSGGDCHHLPDLRVAKEVQLRSRGLIVAEQKGGALECAHTQSSPTFAHIVLIWSFQALHLTKRWYRNCASSFPHHQYLLDGGFLILRG